MGFVAALDALCTVFSAYRYTVFANVNLNWKIVQWVLSWHWQTWLSLWSLVWILVILQGAVAAVRRRENTINTLNAAQDKLTSEKATAEAHASELQQALETLRDQHHNLQSEHQTAMLELEKSKQSPVLSASIKTEETAKPFMMGPQDDYGQPLQFHVTQLKLVIYNHKQEPVVLRGCKLWKLQAAEQTEEIPLHEIVKAGAPTSVDITQPVLSVVSNRRTPPFTIVHGKSSVRVVITYSDGTRLKDYQPFDFELTCGPSSGGLTYRIDAKEQTAEQS